MPGAQKPAQEAPRSQKPAQETFRKPDSCRKRQEAPAADNFDFQEFLFTYPLALLALIYVP